MAIVAITGDACTTTSVALASAWSAAGDAIVIEADPTGGDLAAWFDVPATPSLSTAVTRVLDNSWPEIERLTRLTDSGIRLIPAPARAGEAHQAVGEAARSLVATLAAMRTPTTIADIGDVPLTPSSHPFLAAAAVTVVVHRQATQSANAAAVRLQRLFDQIEAFAGSPGPLIVAVIGASPFAIGEIEEHVARVSGAAPVIGLPVDELSAAVYGGRAGISARRMARLPLARAAADLTASVDAALRSHVDDLWRAVR